MTKTVRMCLIAENPEQIAKLKSKKETWKFDYKIITNEWLVKPTRARLEIETDELNAAKIRKQCECQYFLTDEKDVKHYYVFHPHAPVNRCDWVRMTAGVKGKSVPNVRLQGMKGRYW